MSKMRFTKKQNWLGLTVVLLFAVVGAALLLRSHASGTATLSLSPASGSYNINSKFTLSIYEDTGTAQTAYVEARLSYDVNKLTFESINGNGGSLSNCLTATGGSGKATLACGVAPGSAPLTGRQKLGEVTFTAKVGSGSTPVTFDANSLILLNDGGSTNIWNGSATGGTYTFTTPDTTPPSVRITAPAANAVVQGATVPITVDASDDSGTIKQVEFYVDGALKYTDTSSPYAYTWNTTSGTPDKNYSLTAIAYDAATPTSNQKTSDAVTVTVKNSKPNLIVSSLTLSPAIPKPGDVVTVTATITNNGTAALAAGSAVVTGFSVDSVAVASPADTTALAIGASRTATYSWTAALGNYTILATADKTNVVIETSETDNDKTVTISVKKPGDSNGDNVVNGIDYNAIYFNWQKTGMTRAQGDLNGDGVVNGIDYNELYFYWSK